MKPEQRYAFAIKTGTYAGEIIIFIKQNSQNYEFLSVPKMLNRQIPVEKFKLGVDTGIVDFVEKIPKDVYKIVSAQFEKNSRSLNN